MKFQSGVQKPTMPLSVRGRPHRPTASTIPKSGREGEFNSYGEVATISAHGDLAVFRSNSQAGASAGKEDMEVGYDDSGTTRNAVGAEALKDLEQQFLDQTITLTRA